MNAPILVVTCVALSAGASYLVLRTTAHEPATTVQDPSLRAADPGERIASLEQTIKDLEARVRALDPANARRAEPIDEERLVRAVVARLGQAQNADAGNPAATAVGAAARKEAATNPRTLAEFVALLNDPKLDFNARTDLWKKAKDAGLAEQLLASYEERARNEPNSPQLQVELGVAYLNRMFQTEDGPAKWALPVKADKAFDRALEIDERNWDARFQKAMSLSFWPPFLGKGPEAVRNFEVLIQQQKDAPQRPEFANTYLILGNLLDQQGKHDKALEVWRQGLNAFPDHGELKGKVK